MPDSKIWEMKSRLTINSPPCQPTHCKIWSYNYKIFVIIQKKAITWKRAFCHFGGFPPKAGEKSSLLVENWSTTTRILARILQEGATRG